MNLIYGGPHVIMYQCVKCWYTVSMGSKCSCLKPILCFFYLWSFDPGLMLWSWLWLINKIWSLQLCSRNSWLCNFTESSLENKLKYNCYTNKKKSNTVLWKHLVEEILAICMFVVPFFHIKPLQPNIKII